MLRLAVSNNRSAASIVESAIEIKLWMQRTPTVSEVRPPTCPSCGVASQPAGAPLRLHGHGLRERQIRGPHGPDDRPTLVVVHLRRYQCTACNSVITVVPRHVKPRRLYSIGAIALGLALWGAMNLPASQVRERINPARIVGASAAGTWATLRRWTRALLQRRLLPTLHCPARAGPLRRVAALVATQLAASAPPSLRRYPLWHQAFFGAAHAA